MAGGYFRISQQNTKIIKRTEEGEVYNETVFITPEIIGINKSGDIIFKTLKTILLDSGVKIVVYKGDTPYIAEMRYPRFCECYKTLAGIEFEIKADAFDLFDLDGNIHEGETGVIQFGIAITSITENIFPYYAEIGGTIREE